MGINGIGATGYPAWQGARRAQQNTEGTSFANQVNNVASAPKTYQIYSEEDMLWTGGNGTGGTFGSWQTLNYYRDNAAHNGYFEMTNTMEHFKSIKQDWTLMVSAVIGDYMNAGLYKQALDGNKLLGIFDSLM